MRHHVYYLALDLDELAEVERHVPLIGVERARPLSVRGRDHLALPGESLAEAARRHLAAEGFAATADWRITLVTNARVLGYVFNPVSFYLCHDPAGSLRVVIAEVHNTHGEQHIYTLRPEVSASASFTAAADKAFYVSPFISMDAAYRFHVLERPDGLQVAIHESEREGDQRAPTLYAGLKLERRLLTTGSLLRTLARHPLITLTTIGLIHWHALRLWRRRLTFHPHRAAAGAAAEGGPR
jgi:hypothetical protein